MNSTTPSEALTAMLEQIRSRSAMTQRRRELEDQQASIITDAISRVADIDQQIKSLVGGEQPEAQPHRRMNGKAHATIAKKGKGGKAKAKGGKGSKGRKRPQNERRLIEVVEEVIKKSPTDGDNAGLNLPGIVEAVYNAGYKTSSGSNFSNMVYQQVNKLMEDKVVVKRKDKGKLARYIYHKKAA